VVPGRHCVPLRIGPERGPSRDDRPRPSPPRPLTPPARTLRGIRTTPWRESASEARSPPSPAGLASRAPGGLPSLPEHARARREGRARRAAVTAARPPGPADPRSPTARVGRMRPARPGPCLDRSWSSHTAAGDVRRAAGAAPRPPGAAGAAGPTREPDQEVLSGPRASGNRTGVGADPLPDRRARPQPVAARPSTRLITCARAEFSQNSPPATRTSQE
jgi:hypothetical protein